MSKKLKIAVNARFLIPDKLEGIGTYTHQVLSRLVRILPEVEFHFLFDRALPQEFIYSDNVKARQIGWPARHPVLWYLWFEYALPSWLKKNNIDYLLSLDSFLSLKAKVKTILVMHDLAFEHFPKHNGFLVRSYYKHFFPKYAHRAEHIVAVSQYTKEDLIQRYKIARKAISIGSCGVANEYQPLHKIERQEIKIKISNGHNYFICIGSLNPRKNISNAIKAFNLYKKETSSTSKLLIVGSKGWKTTKLFNEIKNSPYQKDIIRTGHLKAKILCKYLASSSGLIFPSLFEGFGIPIVEALHCQIPIITSNVSSTKEIGEGISCLVDPLDPNAIKNAMIQIDQNLHKNWVNETIKKEKIELYNWDKTAHIFKEIIQSNWQ